MFQTRIVLLNVFSWFCILIITFFSWQYLTIGAAYLRADYRIFHHTLNAHESVYQKHYARYIDQKSQSAPQLAVNLNTPTMNLLLKGLMNIHTQLSVNVLIWMLISIVFSLISIYVLMLYYGVSQYRFLAPFTLLFLTSWPSIYTQVSGEVSFLVLPVLCIAFLLGHFKKWREMAVMLGLLASLKIFFLIFMLGFLMRREWKLAAIFMISFLFFFFLPVIYFSWQEYLLFFQLPSDQQIFISHSGFSMNGALLGFILNIVTFSHKLITFTQLHVIVAALSCYVIFRAVVYYYRYLRYLPNHVYELSFSFLVILGLLLSPLAWVYYYIFLIIPVATLFKINKTYQLSRHFYFLLTLAVLMPVLSWLAPVNKLLLMIRQFSAFIDLLLWLVCLHVAANTIKNSNKKIISAPTMGIIILTISALLSIVLLLCNYGFPHYFTIDKTAYAQDNPPGIWIN